jgi:hypothetical protein
MKSVDAFIAANLFGLGPKGGYLGRISARPQSWLIRQLGTEDGALPYLKELQSSALIQARGSREMRKMFNKHRPSGSFVNSHGIANASKISTETPKKTCESR